MSYKVGDKVLLQGEVFKIEKDNIPYPYGIRIAKGMEFMFGEEEMISKTYSDGLADAWELARKICGNKEGCYEIEDIKNIFNTSGFCRVIDSNTYQEALAKIEAYEESKVIKVGDVVDHQGLKGVVTRVAGDCIYVLTCFGTTPHYTTSSELKKTGRHIDIEHLLEQIRGNE